MPDEAHLRIWSAVLIDGEVRCEVADVGSEEMRQAMQGKRPDRRGFIVHVLDMNDPEVHVNPVDDPHNFNDCNADPCVPGTACSNHHAVARRWWPEWEKRFPQDHGQEELFVAGSVAPEGRFSATPPPGLLGRFSATPPKPATGSTGVEQVLDTIRHWRDQTAEHCLCGTCEWVEGQDSNCPAIAVVSDVCDDFEVAVASRPWLPAQLEHDRWPAQSAVIDSIQLLDDAGLGRKGANTLWAMVKEVIEERDVARGAAAKWEALYDRADDTADEWEARCDRAEQQAAALRARVTELEGERASALATLCGATPQDVRGLDLVSECERMVGAEVVAEEVAEALDGRTTFEPGAVSALAVAALRARALQLEERAGWACETPCGDCAGCDAAHAAHSTPATPGAE